MTSEFNAECLAKENARLKSEVDDLKTMLDAVTGHSDGVAADLLEKIDAGERQFQILSKTIPVPFLIVEQEHSRVFFSNENAQRLFGYTENEFDGKHGSQLYVQSDDRNVFLKLLHDLKRVENFEVKLRKSDGEEFFASLFSQPILFREKQCFLTLIYDLTERKKAEEEKLALEKQLRQTQKLEALGTLSSGISHDFNNILGIIYGNIELAIMILPKESKVIKNLDMALTAVDRAKAMIMQILTFSRQKEQERKPFEISTVVSEVVVMMAALLTSDIRIKMQIADKTSIILGDPTQIHQVVMNLCANARQALQATGGVIKVFLEKVSVSGDDRMALPKLKPGPYVKLTVADNGPGMEREVLERVFDPFFTTKEVGKGTGMGLSVVHGIVLNHDGAVSVESEPGNGTAFHCYLPIAGETQEERSPIIAKDSIMGGTESILLVDDEQAILEIYTELLSSLGYFVESTTQPKQAIRFIQEYPQRYDLVITDHTMPEMSGFSLSKQIHEIAPDLPIVLFSGTGNLPENVDLEKIGIRTFLAKPFSHHSIAGAIRNVLSDVLKAPP